VNVCGPPASASAGLVPAPVNCPFPTGRRTRSWTLPVALPELTEKLVTLPFSGTCIVGLAAELNGTYVQLIDAAQTLVLGVPVVLPSVVVVDAVLSAPAVPTPIASPTPAAAATSATRAPLIVLLLMPQP
jgi:hypothetical protein